MRLGSLLVTLVFVVVGCGKTENNEPDAAGSCTDGVKNGAEGDVDCGGACDACPDGRACKEATDCESGVCTGGTCAAPTCSDGVKNGTELDIDCAGSCAAGSCKRGQTCDDSTQCASQACAGTNVCIDLKKVFLTSQTFTGAQIGGLAGGDAKCQAAAVAAGLKGMFKAWLSDLTGSPSTRFTRSVIEPYIRMDGLVLAVNWDDLTDGTLGGAINRNELNQPQAGQPICDTNTFWVSTNTRFDGVLASDTLSCSNWSSNSGPIGAGRNDQATSSWTFSCSGGTDLCAKPTSIYCFEQ